MTRAAYGLDRLASHGQAGSTRSVRLGNGAVHRGQVLQVLLEIRAQVRVERVPGRPERIAADLRSRQDLERSRARGLHFVGDIRVPEFKL